MNKRFIVALLVFAMVLTSLAPTVASAGVSKDGKTYTVEEGDTLYKIADKVGMSWEELASMNQIKKPYVIDIGQVLKIKKKTVAKPTVTPTPKPTTAPSTTVKHGTTAFKDFTYKRPNFPAFMKKLDKISALTKKENQYQNIEKLVNQIDAAYWKALTMANYLNIMYTKDVTDTKTMKEFNYCSEQLNLIQQRYAAVCIEIFESSYGEEFKKSLTEEDIQAIYDTHDMMTDEFIALTTVSNQLNSDYQIALNTTTIDVNGTPKTLNELIMDSTLPYEELMQYYSKLIYDINGKTGEIYLKLVDNYKSMAKLAGFDSVADYMYDSYDRDYTKEQASQFSQYVKEEIVPLYYSIYASLSEEDIATLQTLPSKLSEMDADFNQYFASINKDMKKAYTYMKKYGLYDFESSTVKQPLTYTTMLYSLNEPYISLYPYGTYTDVSGFVHEFGHFYAFFVHGKELATNLDILEIHSQANELLFTPYYKIYGDAYEPITKNQMLAMLSAIIQGSLYDEFQQYVYANNVSSVQELNEAFFRLECEYGLADPSMGVTQDPSWVYVTHTFQMPFYYISYAVSAVPALEIYQQSLTDRDAAIATYNKVIKLGTDYDFTSLLIRTHLDSPFKEDTLDSIADSIYDLFDLDNPDTVEVPAA